MTISIWIFEKSCFGLNKEMNLENYEGCSNIS